MPAWCWNSILTYEVAGDTFTAETFIYFTQEGYQHAYGQGPLKSSKYLMVEFLPRLVREYLKELTRELKSCSLYSEV